MTEKCTIRSIDKKDREHFIDEQNTPQACIECLQKALNSGRFSRSITNTHDAAVKAMKKFYEDDQDPTDDGQWEATSFLYPTSSADRLARIETGYDFGDESYVPVSVHTTEDITFRCENEPDVSNAVKEQRAILAAAAYWGINHGSLPRHEA